ncbi:large-conductance mechanosensitive channel [Tetzosporium hominis]|uniref:Large-conductance mechanosensitive channel n=2 Tax=Caryophanaceae TaxID=186818 RepID=A0A264W1Q8_9BACL|nr:MULTISPECIES: large conductance mechanosensitive channel protein MscL [Planococcaceae]OZS77494.1 large-conductance mechanosensitive channel [Tetzosporium hominis]PJK16618.1 large conductance mechanosensitive channel protein MscL [Chryseomicrobium excrementi]
MWQDFKAFAFKGNVLELAIAVVIGAAFGKIVASLVENIITPLIGLVMGGVDFSGLAVTVGEANVKYGAFIQSIIDFLIIAFVIFLFIRLLGKLKRKEDIKPEEGPTIDSKEELLIEIRDLLKQQNTLR